MKLALFFTVLSVIFSIAFSALAHYPPPKEAKPGQDCYTDKTGPMKHGEEKIIKNECSKVTCHEDGHATLETCGVAVRPDGSRILADLSKPYPECCNGK